MAENTAPSTFTRTKTPSSFSTFPLLASHACKMCQNQSHRTFVCLLFPREGLTSLAAICADRCFNNYPHLPSSPSRNTKVLQSTCSAPGSSEKLEFERAWAERLAKHSLDQTNTPSATPSLWNDVSCSLSTAEMEINCSGDNHPNNK